MDTQTISTKGALAHMRTALGVNVTVKDLYHFKRSGFLRCERHGVTKRANARWFPNEINGLIARIETEKVRLPSRSPREGNGNGGNGHEESTLVARPVGFTQTATPSAPISTKGTREEVIRVLQMIAVEGQHLEVTVEL